MLSNAATALKGVVDDMPKKIAPAFYFIGNHLVLDFVNTKIAVGGKPVDLLEDFHVLLDWLCKVKLLGNKEMFEYEKKWGISKSKEVFSAALGLRSDLLSIIQKYKNGEQIPENHLEHINNLLRDQVFTGKLVLKDHLFYGEKHRKIEEPGDLLAPIAEGAIDLFSQNKFHLIKKCENPECVLYFYDNSKNSTRRWCSQKTCGNRVKVAAYLKRRRDKEEKMDES